MDHEELALGITGDPELFDVHSSIVARGAIFFIIAALLWKVGPPIRIFIEKRLGLVTILFFVLLFGGFLAARYAI